MWSATKVQGVLHAPPESTGSYFYNYTHKLNRKKGSSLNRHVLWTSYIILLDTHMQGTSILTCQTTGYGQKERTLVYMPQ